MKINVGCGEFPAEGWLNLDLTHESADMRWDATHGLPPVEEHIDRIYAGHVLEHLPLDEVVATLTRWREHPQVDEETQLAVVGPDCDLAQAQVADGTITAEQADIIENGAGRWAGDVHLWRSTADQTAALLNDAGWATGPVPLDILSHTGWPVTSQIGWQFSLIAFPDHPDVSSDR